MQLEVPPPWEMGASIPIPVSLRFFVVWKEEKHMALPGHLGLQSLPGLPCEDEISKHLESLCPD